MPSSYAKRRSVCAWASGNNLVSVLRKYHAHMCGMLLQLGTHLRAKKKREEMGNLLRKAKK